jgi:hypothetical protein
MQVRFSHEMKSDEIGKLVFGNLVDNALRNFRRHYSLLSGLPIDRATVAGEVASICEFKINDLETARDCSVARLIPDCLVNIPRDPVPAKKAVSVYHRTASFH